MVINMVRERIYIEENPQKNSFALALYLYIALFIGIIFGLIYILPSLIIDKVLLPIDWIFVLIYVGIILFGFILVKIMKKIEKIEEKW